MFRVDADAAIGFGHASRCLALANELARRGWSTTWAVQASSLVAPPPGHQRITVPPGQPDAQAAAIDTTLSGGCDLMVVDHYALDARFESACRSFAARILAIDDLADRDHDCDWLLDTGLTNSADDYAHRGGAREALLLGPAYALLRPAFAGLRRTAATRAHGGPLRRVVISMGATDPNGLTTQVLDGLGRSGLALQATVLTTSANPALDSLSGAADRVGAQLIVDADEVALHLAGADLVVGAAGISTWERCCLGLPAIVIGTAANQAGNLEALRATGAAWTVPVTADVAQTIATLLRAANAHPGRLQTCAEMARSLCDGRGTVRVRASTVAAPHARDGRAIRLRPATPADTALVHQWQSTPSMRRHARNPAVPGIAEHENWMSARLRETDGLFDIITVGGEPAGLVRLDPLPDRTRRAARSGAPALEVAILVAPGFQRLGLARHALALARELEPDAELLATVLPGNLPSHSLFARAGYTLHDGIYHSEPHR